MPDFPDDLPGDCPCDAEEVACTIWHGCEEDPASEEDFKPFARSDDEDKRLRATKQGCNAYGISCWRDAAAAKHAQELFEWARRWHIFQGKVTESDGQLKATPSNNQPDHYTFWTYKNVDLRPRFSGAWSAPKPSSKGDRA